MSRLHEHKIGKVKQDEKDKKINEERKRQEELFAKWGAYNDA